MPVGRHGNFGKQSTHVVVTARKARGYVGVSFAHRHGKLFCRGCSVAPFVVCGKRKLYFISSHRSICGNGYRRAYARPPFGQSCGNAIRKIVKRYGLRHSGIIQACARAYCGRGYRCAFYIYGKLPCRGNALPCVPLVVCVGGECYFVSAYRRACGYGYSSTAYRPPFGQITGYPRGNCRAERHGMRSRRIYQSRACGNRRLGYCRSAYGNGKRLISRCAVRPFVVGVRKRKRYGIIFRRRACGDVYFSFIGRQRPTAWQRGSYSRRHCRVQGYRLRRRGISQRSARAYRGSGDACLIYGYGKRLVSCGVVRPLVARVFKFQRYRIATRRRACGDGYRFSANRPARRRGDSYSRVGSKVKSVRRPVIRGRRGFFIG